MPTDWKWKAAAVLVSLVCGFYMLVPTLLQVESRREALAAQGQTLPWYYTLLPDKALTLGLDLQGGIYVELEVALEEAVQRKTDILGDEIRRELGDDAGITAIVQPAPGQLELTVRDPAALEAVDGILRRYYRQVFASRGVGAEDRSLVMRLALTDDYRKTLEANVVEQATESVRNRINRYGVGEPDIRRQGTDRIAIEMPGLKDPDRALSLIKRTGQLEFRMVHEVATPAALEAQQQTLQMQVGQARHELGLLDTDWTLAAAEKINQKLADTLPEGHIVAFELVRDPQTRAVQAGIPFLVEAKARVTGDMLDDAYVTVEQNEPKVAFALNKTGTKIFADVTKNHVDHYFAIMLDGTIMSAPSIKEPILQGHGVITLGVGNFDAKQREAKDLTLILQEGALPATLTEASKTVVGPSLGAELIRQGFRASWMAALAVVLFMVLYYRTAGLVADLALGLNVLLILAILTMFGATLTLPGIAGIVLTIGMAVDANVIINERIREEVRAGKAARVAMEEGYANANSAILDSNLTTLIAGIVLYQFGTGSIKGFAVTLCVGILTTLFTAVFVTRVIFEWLYRRRAVVAVAA